MEEPLLFIPSPPFYYVEVTESKNEETILDESTSVFEINRSERIKDPVIARQLHFFLQPSNRNGRYFTFNLKNGESVTGKIINLIGINVVIQTLEEEVSVNANDIDSIQIAD